jgi:cytochrome c
MVRFTIPFAILTALAFAAPRLVQAQGTAAGQRVSNQCRACHSFNGGSRAGVGPNPHGVAGRPAGTVEGFRYSASMRAKAEAGLIRNEETLRAYIRNPKEVVPAGSMAFPGLRDEQQLNDLIAYLKQQS